MARNDPDATELILQDAGRCDRLTSAGWAALAAGCRRLRTLAPYGIGNEGLASLAKVADQLTSVELLDLYGSQDVTDAGVAAVCSLRGLVELDLNYCPGVTDIGLLLLAAGLPRLRRLSLAGAARITDAGVAAIARLPLRQLCLNGCPRVGSAGLRSLVQHCHGLQRLDVRNCGGVTDAMHMFRSGWEGCQVIA